MSEITFYLKNNPAYLNQIEQFQVGFINDAGSLSDITNTATIEIEQPSGIIIQTPGTIVVNSNVPAITIFLKITYLTYTPQYFSFCLIKSLDLVTFQKLYNTFLNYLPKNVYNLNHDPDSPVFDDNTATVETLYQLYQTNISNPQFTDLYTVLQRIFPSSGYPAWEQALVGTNSLYLQENTDYPSLLQLFYQTNTNNNTNPYFLALNISKYIYYRLGIKKYVYIGEDVFNVNDAFVLNKNTLSQCIFSGTENGSSTYLVTVYIIDGSSLAPVFQHELDIFIMRIMKAGLQVIVDYDHTFADFGLVAIGNTYWKDPRQGNTYCIEFNEGVLAEALGYSNGGNITNITDFTVTLTPTPGGTMLAPILTQGQTYSVAITPTYSTPTTLPQPIIFYTEFFSSNQNTLNFYFNAGVEYFTANAVGTANMNIYLGIILKTLTCTVNP